MAIVVIGAVFLDIKGFPDDIYIPDGRNAGTVKFVHGGVGRNVAEDIGNLELRPRFVSMVDDSPEAAAIIRKLNNHKVNTDYVVTVPNGMGMWLAVFNENGDVAGSISKRPDIQPLRELLKEKGDEIISQADSVIIEIDIDKEIAKTVFSLAAKYGKKVYAVVANMGIALERRDLIQKTDCIVCNEQEAGMLFIEDYSVYTPEQLCDIIENRITSARIPAIVVTLGARGCVYASIDGEKGIYPAEKVHVADTTGAGDSFCAGVAAGLTYGKSLRDSVAIGTKLAASVIAINENTCPRFQPEEFGLTVKESLN